MRGVPKDHPEERPSHIIFDDLIARAIDQADKTSMNLGLYVDKRNLAAIKFYKKFGLYEIPMPRKNGDPSLMAMLCNLITEVRRLHP